MSKSTALLFLLDCGVLPAPTNYRTLPPARRRRPSALTEVPLSSFAGGQSPNDHFVRWFKREARAMREKLSKAKPRDIKGVVCRGLPWVLFWPGNS